MYALLNEEQIVVQLSNVFSEGMIEVSDAVFPGFRQLEDGTFEAPPAPPVSPEDVNEERDRRTQAGFLFAGKHFDFDMRSKTNISGAAQMAFMVMIGGAQAGNLRWNGGSQDFSWIAKDNSLVPMDAQTVVAFGQAAAAHEQAHVLAARALKNMGPIPSDYQDDKWWP